MAEEEKKEIEAKDPWDFDDPELMEVPAQMPDEFESDRTSQRRICQMRSVNVHRRQD